MKPVVLALVADTHSNSMVGLCPPKGVTRTCGETRSKYVPGKEQRWLYECYEDAINRAAKLAKKNDADFWVAKVGDGSDDNTHSKHGLIALLTDEIVDIGHQVDRPILATADRLFITNGTPAHTGRGSALEKLIAKREYDEYKAGKHKCEIVKGKYGYTRWIWHIRASGVYIRCQHKPSNRSNVPWTRGNGANRTAFNLFAECERMGWDVPDAAYFAHFHYPADSGENHRIRTFFCPCLKLHGNYESSNGFRAEPVGIRVAICDSGRFYPEPTKDWLYYVKGDEIWEPK